MPDAAWMVVAWGVAIFLVLVGLAVLLRLGNVNFDLIVGDEDGSTKPDLHPKGDTDA